MYLKYGPKAHPSSFFYHNPCVHMVEGKLEGKLVSRALLYEDGKSKFFGSMYGVYGLQELAEYLMAKEYVPTSELDTRPFVVPPVNTDEFGDVFMVPCCDMFGPMAVKLDGKHMRVRPWSLELDYKWKYVPGTFHYGFCTSTMLMQKDRVYLGVLEDPEYIADEVSPIIH